MNWLFRDKIKKLVVLLGVLALTFSMWGCSSQSYNNYDEDSAYTTGDKDSAYTTDNKGLTDEDNKLSDNKLDNNVKENGTYDSKKEVAAYIVKYKKLPKNYITKSKAKSMGWHGGSLKKYVKKKCIGGDFFGNYERKLPKKNYKECDIDTMDENSRGAKRIIYSDDGWVYYTDNHYKSFELLHKGR